MSRAAATGRATAAIALLLLLAAPLAEAQPAAPGPTGPPAVAAQFRSFVGERMDMSQAAVPFQSAFTLGEHRGYRVDVAGVGSSVAIEVARANGKAVSVYLAKGTVTPGRLEASFGRLGRVSMRFRPSPNRTWIKPHRRCHGAGRFVKRLGTYSGAVRFDGEGGYLSLRAHRAPGHVSSIALQCLPGRNGQRKAIHDLGSWPIGGGSQAEVVSAGWRHGVATVSFLALRNGVRTRFQAIVEQSEGRLGIIRVAHGSGSAGAATFDDALTRARVKPPAPFSGTGTYTAAADGTTTWAGSLAVNFPGAERFPLTGAPFEATLAAGFPSGD